MATGGDSALGGDDYDQRFASALLSRAGLKTLEELAPGERRRVQTAARRAKEALSESATATLSFEVDGHALKEALRRGCARATREYPLRSSVVHPLTRRNEHTSCGIEVPVIHIDFDDSAEQPSAN